MLTIQSTSIYCVCLTFLFSILSIQLTARPDSEPAQAFEQLLQTAADLRLTKPDSAIQLANKALQLAQLAQDDKGTALASQELGRALAVKLDFKAALEQLKRAHAYFSKTPEVEIQSALLLEMGKASIHSGQMNQSIEYLKECLLLSKQHQLDRLQFDALLDLSLVYAHAGQPEEAKALFEQAQQTEKDEEQRLRVYLRYFALQLNSGTLEAQRDTLLQALALSQKLEKHQTIVSVRAHLGDIYSQMGQKDKAAENYGLLIDLSEKHQLKAGKLTAYISLGSLYNELNDYSKALHYDSLALSISVAENLPVYIANSHLQLGAVYQNLADYQHSEHHFQAALSVFESLKSRRGVIECKLQLSKIHNALGQYERALSIIDGVELLLPESWNLQAISVYLQKGISFKYSKDNERAIASLHKALSLAKNGGESNLLQQIYQELSQSYEAFGQTNLALNYLKKYELLKDSLYQSNNEQALLELTTKYEAEKKEQQLTTYQQRTKLQASELSRKNAYLIISLLFLVLASLIFLGVWFRMAHKKRTSELLSQNKQIQLEKEKIEAVKQLEIEHIRMELLADLSHDFRSPLSLILAPVDQLLKTSHPTDHPKIQMIRQNARKLLELVNQSLKVANTQQVHLNCHPKKRDLSRFLKDIQLSFSPLEESKAIRLDFISNTQQIFAQFDDMLLEKAISNLILNAFEHTESGGAIKLILDEYQGTDKEDGSEKWAKLLISDNGKGIAPEHQKYIFDRYYRVEKDGNKGSGIGLAMAKNIIEEHGGSVSVESWPGVGTNFIILLPMIQVEEIEQTTPLIANRALSLTGISNEQIPDPRPLLFVVEDNEDIRDYLRNLFDRNYQYCAYADPQQALSDASTRNPDLIISDIKMPQMNGLVFYKKLKMDIKTSHIPVILLSAKASTVDKVKALELGVDDYVTKPFVVEELQLRVKNLIQARRKLWQKFTSNPGIPEQDITSNELDKAFLQKCRKTIEENMEDDNFGVLPFSRMMGMSRTSLYNKIRSLTGENLASYIRMVRLQKAANLLQSKHYNILEVAQQAGFQSRQSFNKSFKIQFGMTPSQYKKSKRNKSMIR